MTEPRAGEAPRPALGRRLGPALAGAALGILTAFAANAIGLGAIPGLNLLGLTPVAALLGAALGATRARGVLWAISGAVAAALLGVGYTPLSAWLVPGLIREDPLQPAPAVVVLGDITLQDGRLTNHAQERILQGYRVLRAGYAPRLVLTRGGTPWVEAVRQQMHELGLNQPVDETPLISNTHDEAREVARLARARGWERVILVTHPWHMRRAQAVFEKQGLHVICSPCVEGGYDVHSLTTPGDRIRSFRDWVHETVGYQVYHCRGWI
jgi:uncharacterized SAM-binding protein YcdF (DUF218 family)